MPISFNLPGHFSHPLFLNNGLTPAHIGLLQAAGINTTLGSKVEKPSTDDIIERMQRQRGQVLEGVPLLSAAAGSQYGQSPTSGGGLLAQFASRGADQIAKGQSLNPTLFKPRAS